ncbi:MAG: radical SAM protein [Armatimonadetes bacterium]|nr:radical SAM protein [Armatimonadota bacterium]
MPDNGMANLAGVLHAAGHDVLVLDYGTVGMMRRLFPRSVATALRAARGSAPDLRVLDRELELHAEREVARLGEELCNLVQSYQPDFVGFKLWHGDGCSGSVALARSLRRCFPGLFIIGGGPQVTFAIKPVIEHSGCYEPLDDGTFDVLVQSEGEDLMPALAEVAVGRASLAGVPNTLYREDGRIRIAPVEHVRSLDSLPPPLYDTDVYPSMGGDSKLHLITLDESRGCPYNCSFCIQPLITGHDLRLRSARRVVDEMERCVRSYHVGVFRFAGSATPGRLLDEIATEILARGLQVRYSAFGRGNNARPDAFSRARQSGLEALFFGVESGSQRILDEVMNKGVRISKVRETLKAALGAGIFTVASIIAPAPRETSATWQETLELLADVRPDAVLVSPPGPVAGTAWYREGERFGIRIGEGFQEALLSFKFRMLLPADQWQYPEYWVDGKDTRTIAEETMAALRQIEELGLLTRVSDDMLLMARYCHLTPREFRDQTQRWLCTGNWEAVAALVAEMNGAIREAARAAVAALDDGATALPSVA